MNICGLPLHWQSAWKCSGKKISKAKYNLISINLLSIHFETLAALWQRCGSWTRWEKSISNLLWLSNLFNFTSDSDEWVKKYNRYSTRNVNDSECSESGGWRGVVCIQLVAATVNLHAPLEHCYGQLERQHQKSKSWEIHDPLLSSVCPMAASPPIKEFQCGTQAFCKSN